MVAIKTIYNQKPVPSQQINQPISSLLPTPVVQKPKMVDPNEAIYQQASQSALKNYGINVPPHFLKAVQQQESSNIIDPNDYGRSFGLVNATGENGAKMALGKKYLPDSSLLNSATNSANYLASRAHFKSTDGTVKDLSTPENQSKWYVQRYVGLLPGESRIISGQKVTYDQVKSSFEKVLKSNQPK